MPKKSSEQVTLARLLEEGPIDTREYGDLRSIRHPSTLQPFAEISTTHDDGTKTIIYGGYGVRGIKTAIRIIRQAGERDIDLDEIAESYRDK